MPSDVKWTDVVQVLVGLVGIPLIIYQLRELQKSIQGETLSELYDHYHQVMNVLLERSHLRPYFYENQRLEPSANPALRLEIESMCDLMAALLEHALVQEKNVPRASWAECWETFVMERLRKSSVLQEYLAKNADWYLKKFPSLRTALQSPAAATLA